MLSPCHLLSRMVLLQGTESLPSLFFWPDKPGELVRVSQVIADKRGNVIKLDHNQFFSTNRSAAVELKITLEAFGTEHKKEIIQALEEAGYKPKQIRPNL